MESKLKYLIYRKIPGLDGGELVAAFADPELAAAFLQQLLPADMYYRKDLQ